MIIGQYIYFWLTDELSKNKFFRYQNGVPLFLFILFHGYSSLPINHLCRIYCYFHCSNVVSKFGPSFAEYTMPLTSK